MSKTVKQKAKEWMCHERTVSNYCLSGIIPPAIKEGRPPKWIIPDEWPKPPMGRHGLCFLLDTIYQLNHGVDYSALKFGYTDTELKNGYDYLISSAFMSTIDTCKLSEELKNAIVTPRGELLVQRENSESKGKITFKAHVATKANIGVASIEMEAEVSNK